MRLLGKDKAREFLTRHRRATWIADVHAFLCELDCRTWSNEAELARDYPGSQFTLPDAVISIAGGRVLVACKILLERGLILLERLFVAQPETHASLQSVGDLA